MISSNSNTIKRLLFNHHNSILCEVMNDTSSTKGLLKLFKTKKMLTKLLWMYVKWSEELINRKSLTKHYCLILIYVQVSCTGLTHSLQHITVLTYMCFAILIKMSIKSLLGFLRPWRFVIIGFKQDPPPHTHIKQIVLRDQYVPVCSFDSSFI